MAKRNVGSNNDVMIIRGKATADEEALKAFKADALTSYLIISESTTRLEEMRGYVQAIADNPQFILCESGIDALKNCQQRKFDMILCDYQTKFLGGWNFVKEFKNNASIPNMPILLFSDNLELLKKDLHEKRHLLKEYGILTVLHVPLKPLLLKKAIGYTIGLHQKQGTTENLYTRAKEAFIGMQFKSSKQIFKKIYDQTPDLARSNMSMSNVYKQEDNLEAMNKHIEKVVKVDKDNLSARYLLFEIAVEKGDVDKQAEIIQDLRKHAPATQNIIGFNLATILYKFQNFEHIPELLSILYPDKTKIPLYISLIEVKSYIKLDLVTDAWNALQLVLQHKTEDVELFNLAAIVARKKNDIPASIQYYQKALSKAPSDCRIMYNLALAYHYKGESQKALEYAKLVQKIEPGFGKITKLIETLTNLN